MTLLRFIIRDLLQIGDVVVFDPTRHGSVMKSTQSYEHDIVGVVSGKGFANIMSLSESAVNEPNQYPIALLGKMMIKVSLKMAPLNRRPLTTSSIPGYAMKATQSTRIVGYAFEHFDGKKQSSDGVETMLENIKIVTNVNVAIVYLIQVKQTIWNI